MMTTTLPDTNSSAVDTEIAMVDIPADRNMAEIEDADADQESLTNGIYYDKQNDDDDVTVIVLDQSPEDINSRQFPIAWNEQAGPQVEERRRTILLRELQRVQRTSFLHFLILCLIPTVLLFIVIATVVNEDEDCSSDATYCEKEERNFINAFTTRCICDAIVVPRPY